MKNAAAPALDFTQGYRLLLATDVQRTETSVDIKFADTSLGFALEKSIAHQWGLDDLEPGQPVLVKGKTGNTDAALWGMNVIAEMRPATMLEALQHMFIGKLVFITHEDTNAEDAAGICVAIHKTPGEEAMSFDVELTAGRRYGILAEELTADSVKGPLARLLRGTRKISAEKHVFQKKHHYMFGFDYNGGRAKEVVVETPTAVYETDLLFHFMYGVKSLSETVAKDKIVAVGDHDGLYRIRGWGGSYRILSRVLWDEYVARGVITLD